MTTKPKTISLYSGGGGLDYGFEAAGFETVTALDIDHDSCETLRKNRRWPVIERSIFATSTEEILETACVKPGEVDLVIGGPPFRQPPPSLATVRPTVRSVCAATRIPSRTADPSQFAEIPPVDPDPAVCQTPRRAYDFAATALRLLPEKDNQPRRP